MTYSKLEIGMFVVTCLMFIATIIMLGIGIKALYISSDSLKQSILIFDYEKNKTEPNLIIEKKYCPDLINYAFFTPIEIHNSGELPIDYIIEFVLRDINGMRINNLKHKEFWENVRKDADNDKDFLRMLSYDKQINNFSYHNWIEGKKTQEIMALFYSFKDARDLAELKVTLKYKNKTIELLNCKFKVEGFSSKDYPGFKDMLYTPIE